MGNIRYPVNRNKYKDYSLISFDMYNNEKIRKIYSQYLTFTNGIVFVIDSADSERLEESFKELRFLINKTETQDKPLLIFANKQDLKDSISPNEMIKKYKLDDICNNIRKWKIQGCSATYIIGIIEGLDWITKLIDEKYW